MNTDGSILDALAAYDNAVDWATVLAILVGVLGVLAGYTLVAVFYYRTPVQDRSLYLTSLAWPMFFMILAPLSILIIKPLILDDHLAILESEVRDSVAEHVEFDVEKASLYYPESGDPHHVKETPLAMTVELQPEDSMYTSSVLMIYNEEYDMMIPADPLMIDLLPIRNDSPLSKDGHVGHTDSKEPSPSSLSENDTTFQYPTES